MNETPTIKQRIVFAIISGVVFYFLFDLVINYLFQDSSPKQTVVLLEIVILIIAALVAYFFFFRISKSKVEDVGKFIFNKSDKRHLIVSIVFIVVILVVCLFSYRTYRNIRLNIELNQLKQSADLLHQMQEDFDNRF